MLPTSIRLGGLVWKNPWRMSQTRKANLRKRLKEVDSVIATLNESGVQTHSLEVANKLPKESEMPSRDKYFTFVKNLKGHRKSVHKVPHFTKKTNRTNPLGF